MKKIIWKELKEDDPVFKQGFIISTHNKTRQDYIKQARSEAENSRVSIRNVRRDANQTAKEKQQSSEISEDELRGIENLIQKETDKFISLVDSELKNKESDLLEI